MYLAKDFQKLPTLSFLSFCCDKTILAAEILLQNLLRNYSSNFNPPKPSNLQSENPNERPFFRRFLEKKISIAKNSVFFKRAIFQDCQSLVHSEKSLENGKMGESKNLEILTWKKDR